MAISRESGGGGASAVVGVSVVCMAERINLVPGSEDGVRAAAAVVFSRPHGREDCEEEQAHRVGLGAVAVRRVCGKRTELACKVHPAIRRGW